MILPIYIYGQPVLRKVAEDITPDYPELETLVKNMFDTLESADGVGLAAPQVGLPIRVVVVDLDALARDYPIYKDFRKVFINGHIVEEDENNMESMEEGCLSIPGVYESVTRPTRIRVQYLNEKMEPQDEWIDGYLARVVQHEFDHLEGKVFIDHISMIRKQLIKTKLGSLLKGKANCSYKAKVVR